MTPYYLCKKAFGADPHEHPALAIDSVIYYLLSKDQLDPTLNLSSLEVVAVMELKLIADLSDMFFCGKSCDDASVRSNHAQ